MKTFSLNVISNFRVQQFGGSKAVTKPGTSAGQSSASTPSATVAKPTPKPGQKTDTTGWPVNAKNQRVDGSGHAIDKQGRKINDLNQLIDKSGHAVNERNQRINDKGHRINDNGQRINTLGKPVDDKSRLIDSENRLINSSGRLINDQGKFIDKDGKQVNKEGYLVDKFNRPLDADGHVARSKQSAALGNNEPHKQVIGFTQSLSVKAPLDPANGAPPPKVELSQDAAAQKTNEINQLVETGAIPPASSKTKVARDALITSTVSGLVSIPANTASTASTTTTAESIKAQYLPKPLASAAAVTPAVASATPVASTPATATPVASTPASAIPVAGTGEQATAAGEAQAPVTAEQSALNVKLDELQVSILSTFNQGRKLNGDKNSDDLRPGPDWPNDPLARAEKLQGVLDDAEQNADDISKNWKVYFERYLPETSAPEGIDGLGENVATLEKRLAEVQSTHDEALKKIKSKTLANPA